MSPAERRAASSLSQAPEYRPRRQRGWRVAAPDRPARSNVPRQVGAGIGEIGEELERRAVREGPARAQDMPVVACACELSAGETRHDLSAPGHEEIADEREPFVSLRCRGCIPIELRRAKGRFRQRVWNLVTQRLIGGLELLASTFAYRVSQSPMEIAEERKRLRRSPLFAHEQERRHGCEQRDGERGGQSGPVRLHRETVTQRAIADLVVVLQKIDERERRQRTRWFSAAAPSSVTGDLILIGEAGGQYARDVSARIVGVILIVSRVLSGQQDMPGVMVVVIPLRAVFSLRRIGARIEQARLVVVVLQDEMDRSPGGGGEMPDHAAEIMQDGRPAGLHQGMNRIEPQAVETIAPKPMQRIPDREGADLRNTIIDGMAPRRMGGSEERRRITMQEVSFRAEMIVDDVEKHHQAARMRCVDQCAQVIGPAIGAVRRIEQDSVVSPVAPASEVGNRHQLDRRQSGLDHVIELLYRRAKRAAGGECADMKLQERRVLPRPPPPVICPPFEAVVIDHFAWPEYVLRLKVRGRIHNLDLGVNAILVERAGASARYREFVPALRLRVHRMGAIKHHVDAFRRRCPEAERNPTLAQLGAKAHACHHAAPENTRIERGRASSFAPEGSSSLNRALRAVSNSTVQWLCFGRAGSVNSMASGAALSTT